MWLRILLIKVIIICYTFCKLNKHWGRKLLFDCYTKANNMKRQEIVIICYTFCKLRLKLNWTHIEKGGWCLIATLRPLLTCCKCSIYIEQSTVQYLGKFWLNKSYLIKSCLITCSYQATRQFIHWSSVNQDTSKTTSVYLNWPQTGGK